LALSRHGNALGFTVPATPLRVTADEVIEELIAHLSARFTCCVAPKLHTQALLLLDAVEKNARNFRPTGIPRAKMRTATVYGRRAHTTSASPVALGLVALGFRPLYRIGTIRLPQPLGKPG
jgi:hypothetical protein